jgi:hypothetical protein
MHASSVSKMEVEPILCSIPQGCQMLSIGTQGMYDLIGAGLVKAVKRGTRTLLVVESLKAYAKTLPRATVAPPRKREPQHLRQAEADKPQQLPQMEAKTGPPRERRRRRQAESETTNA